MTRMGRRAACASIMRNIWPTKTHELYALAATWKGRAVAVKVMLASHGEHAGELESFRQEVKIVIPETVHASNGCPAHGQRSERRSVRNICACICLPYDLPPYHAALLSSFTEP